MSANAYLEGTYAELYPDIAEDEQGLRKLFRQFSFPGGIPSHAAPGRPVSVGSAHCTSEVCKHAFMRAHTTIGRMLR